MRAYLYCLRSIVLAIFCLSILSIRTEGQQPRRPAIDITHYHIEAELQPAEHTIRAIGDVTFTPFEATRSVVFELNGSLKVESIERNGTLLTNIAQDAFGTDVIGPNIRVDLGDVVPAGQPVTLRFRWNGALITPEGGPLPTKRLAYIGTEGSYLMYAARWFPFHNYAADRATADITIIVPTGVQVAGWTDDATTTAVTTEAQTQTTKVETATSTGANIDLTKGRPSRLSRTRTNQIQQLTTQQQQPTVKPMKPLSLETAKGMMRYRFVHRRPGLIGNIAAGTYINKSLNIGGYQINFYAKPGSENQIDQFAEVMGKALGHYTKQYGEPFFGKKYVVVQIDDASLDTYAAPGMQFLATKLFSTRNIPQERLQREVAYQWWGHTVGLKSFDDVWLSQGLAEWSAFALREQTLSGGALESAQRDMQERALMFEQTASILRAPQTLDDQSAAYQSIVFYKGAMVFRMLRSTMGREKFDQLLRRYLEKYRGQNASIDEFETLTSQVAGENMRYFFARWVEGTGVPEFTVDYQVIRTRAGKFRTRGTVKQNYETLRMPVELALRSEGENKDQITTLPIEGKSEDFDFESSGKPIEVIVDPNNKILRMSEDLRISIVARRGIELFQEGQYAEAQRQLEEALKLDKSNSWIYYHLGLIHLEQRNYQQALDNFQAAVDGNLKPSWIEVWAHIKRGNAYDAQGDRTRAVAEYNKAIQTGINHDNAQSIAKEFIEHPYDPRRLEQAQQ
jgi:tetratricopeptide (TPR) repeat protein